PQFAVPEPGRVLKPHVDTSRSALLEQQVLRSNADSTLVVVLDARREKHMPHVQHDYAPYSKQARGCSNQVVLIASPDGDLPKRLAVAHTNTLFFHRIDIKLHPLSVRKIETPAGWRKNAIVEDDVGVDLAGKNDPSQQEVGAYKTNARVARTQAVGKLL